MTTQSKVEEALGMSFGDLDVEWDVEHNLTYIIVRAWPVGLSDDGINCAHTVLDPDDPNIKQAWGMFLAELAAIHERAIETYTRHWSMHAKHLSKLGKEYLDE